MGARRGSKNTALLEAPPEPVEAPGDVYVVARRPLTYLGVTIPVGVEVPDAHGWLRRDAWVHARYIRRVSPGEEYTSYADFIAAQDAGEESEEPAQTEE